MGAAGYGAIAGVAGGAIQGIAAELAAQAMARQFQAQQDLQRGFANQAYTTWEPAVQQMGVETAREQLGQGQAGRQAAYQAVNQPLAIGAAPTARDQAAYNMAGQAKAKLGSYGDWTLKQHIKNLRTQDELNRIANFAGGEANVFPYKMQSAQHSWDDLAFLGQLIGAAGGASGSFGSLYGQQALSQHNPYSLYATPYPESGGAPLNEHNYDSSFASESGI